MPAENMPNVSRVPAVLRSDKLSDGLFLREVRKMAAEDPDAELEELIVDATAALLIRTPDMSGTMGMDAFSAVVANPIGSHGATDFPA